MSYFSETDSFNNINESAMKMIPKIKNRKEMQKRLVTRLSQLEMKEIMKKIEEQVIELKMDLKVNKKMNFKKHLRLSKLKNELDELTQMLN